MIFLAAFQSGHGLLSENDHNNQLTLTNYHCYKVPIVLGKNIIEIALKESKIPVNATFFFLETA